MSSMLDLLESCKFELIRNRVPGPYEITMPEALWRALKVELEKIPGSRTTRRRFMGRVMDFDIYVDDSAPPGEIQFR